MISISNRGSFKNTEKLLKKSLGLDYISVLEKYGREGVQALSAATPVDSGKTSTSWNYRINRNRTGISLEFYNTNVNKGVNIAIILQYGHGTRQGGWVQGRDYINPALKPIFDQLADAAWKEVTSI